MSIHSHNGAGGGACQAAARGGTGSGFGRSASDARGGGRRPNVGDTPETAPPELASRIGQAIRPRRRAARVGRNGGRQGGSGPSGRRLPRTPPRSRPRCHGGHRRAIAAPGLLAQPAGEPPVLGEVVVRRRVAPGGAVAQAAPADIVPAVEGEVMERADQPAVGLPLEVTRGQRAAEDRVPPGPGDAVGEAKPVAVDLVPVGAPDQVLVEDEAIRETGAQDRDDRGLAGAARADDDEERQDVGRRPPAACRATRGVGVPVGVGQRPGAAARADERHGGTSGLDTGRQ